jgi:hypothetical protein
LSKLLCQLIRAIACWKEREWVRTGHILAIYYNTLRKSHISFVGKGRQYDGLEEVWLVLAKEWLPNYFNIREEIEDVDDYETGNIFDYLMFE